MTNEGAKSGIGILWGGPPPMHRAAAPKGGLSPIALLLPTHDP
jgi:hypothetical protein